MISSLRREMGSVKHVHSTTFQGLLRHIKIISRRLSSMTRGAGEGLKSSKRYVGKLFKWLFFIFDEYDKLAVAF